MPSLQDQLNEVYQKEAKHKRVLKRLGMLESWNSNIEGFTGFLGFVFTVGLYYSTIHWWPNNWWPNGWNIGALSIVLIYGAIFSFGWLIVYSGIYLEKGLKVLGRTILGISKTEEEQITSLRKKFTDEKSEINRQIKAAQKVIDDKIYEEKKTAFRIEENKFIFDLNTLVGKAERSELEKEKIIELKTELELQKVRIRNFGYQIYTHVYYNNRFTKLNDLLDGITSNAKFKVTPTLPASTVEKKSEPVKPTIIPPVAKVETPKPIILPQRVVEKPISELVPLPTKTDTPPEKTRTFRLTPKQNFEKLNTQRHEIGKLGEAFVYEGERKQLWEKQLFDLSDNVKWVSQDSDAYGYDIVSYEDDGTPKYIEVKTTTGNKQTPFYVSEVELNAMNSLDNYIICRVYNWNSEACAKYTVKKDRLDDFFDLEPQSYKVKPKF